jgi:(+)-trans-carveol dehydrogenase
MTEDECYITSNGRSAMKRVAGKVALVTGVARGQGRSHAVRLAEEGADIIGFDICRQVDSAPYPLATEEDLQHTADLIKGAGGRADLRIVDVRDAEAVKANLNEAVEGMGRLDIVAANAGIISYGKLEDLDESAWQEVLDTNLTGVWNTCKAAAPHIRAGGSGGSIHVTSSALGLIVLPNIGHYAAAKHGLTALVRTFAIELGADKIRVNAIHPGQVDTDLVHNDATYRLFRPDLESPSREDFIAAASPLTALGIPYVEAIDISNALLFLASDEARYITGATLSVDGGTVLL